jgi:hypothetical protein
LLCKKHLLWERRDDGVLIKLPEELQEKRTDLVNKPILFK